MAPSVVFDYDLCHDGEFAAVLFELGRCRHHDHLACTGERERRAPSAYELGVVGMRTKAITAPACAREGPAPEGGTPGGLYQITVPVDAGRASYCVCCGFHRSTSSCWHEQVDPHPDDTRSAGEKRPSEGSAEHILLAPESECGRSSAGAKGRCSCNRGGIVPRPIPARRRSV